HQLRTRSPHKFRTTWPAGSGSPREIPRQCSGTTQHLPSVEAVENSGLNAWAIRSAHSRGVHQRGAGDSLARSELALELVQLLADAGVDLTLPLDLPHRGDHGGVVLVKPGRDLRERAPGELPGEIHRHLTGVRELLGPPVGAQLLHCHLVEARRLSLDVVDV